MTLIIRSATDFQPGDRVYDADTKLIRLFEGYSKHQFSKGFLQFEDHKYSYHPQPYHMANRRFLRVIEPGETIPKDAVTRLITLVGLDIHKTWDREYIVGEEASMRVLVSLPEPVEDKRPVDYLTVTCKLDTKQFDADIERGKEAASRLNPNSASNSVSRFDLLGEVEAANQLIKTLECKLKKSRSDHADLKQRNRELAALNRELQLELDAAKSVIAHGREADKKLREQLSESLDDVSERERILIYGAAYAGGLEIVGGMQDAHAIRFFLSTIRDGQHDLENQSSKPTFRGTPDTTTQSVPSEPIQTGNNITEDIRDAFKDALAATPYCNLACGNEQPSLDALLQAAATIYASPQCQENTYQTKQFGGGDIDPLKWSAGMAHELARHITQTMEEQ